MYKQIIEHKAYMTKQLASELNESERQQLYHYHIDRVRDFQHERFIHLIVTFFFAGLLLATFVAWFSVVTSALLVNLLWPLSLLLAILFVLELAYVRHYYQLENGVQSLYSFTDKLGKLRK